MPKQPTITVGIPAHNEEQNIKLLLEMILDQKQQVAALKEILVVSDGSTDNTPGVVTSLRDPRIKLVVSATRQGMTQAQNRIVAAATGDVLVMLDGDVLPTRPDFLEKIIEPILRDGGVVLVGADTVSARPVGFFEGVIALSHSFKTRIYRQINRGDNIYNCHGRARAFSRAFYQGLRWPVGYSEDAYSYLFCLRQGFKFAFAPGAQVLFRSPRTFADHMRQSRRFVSSRRQLEQFFSASFVSEQYRIPLRLLLSSFFQFFFKFPARMTLYSLIYVYLRFFNFYRPPGDGQYVLSQSTKKVI